jgi:hypothetical protein
MGWIRFADDGQVLEISLRRATLNSLEIPTRLCRPQAMDEFLPGEPLSPSLPLLDVQLPAIQPRAS